METERGKLAETARGVTDRLRQDGRQQLETRKHTAADSIDEVARALSRAGEQLDQSQPTLASYTNQMANSISSLATRIREGSMEDLLEDTRQIARRNPGLFVLGSFAAGVALARFMKASEHNVYETDDFSTSAAGASTDDYRSDFASASADQSAYPSQEYSPSVSTSDQPSSQSSTSQSSATGGASSPYPPTTGV